MMKNSYVDEAQPPSSLSLRKFCIIEGAYQRIAFLVIAYIQVRGKKSEIGIYRRIVKLEPS